MTRIGFYAHGAISPHFPKIRRSFDSVPFTSEEIARLRSESEWELANVIEAACGPSGRAGELAARTRAEGVAVLQAAGIDVASDEEDRERRGDLLRMRPIDGQRRGGGSTWQSLARGATKLETDYLVQKRLVPALSAAGSALDPGQQSRWAS